MEDLVPFLIFIVIVVINLLKVAAEKGRGKKTARPASGKAPPERKPSSLEEFFESLAVKLEPQPAKSPNWPEGRERPDYLKEMDEFEAAPYKAFEDDGEETFPMPSPPAPAIPEGAMDSLKVVLPLEKTASLGSAIRSMSMTATTLRGMRIESAPILRSGTAGRIDFPLGQKAQLRKAVIANMIFSPPRAYDVSFDNTIAK